MQFRIPLHLFQGQNFCGLTVFCVQGGLTTKDGGLAIKNLSVLNPFDPNAKPINLRFSAERPSFNLPQVYVYGCD